MQNKKQGVLVCLMLLALLAGCRAPAVQDFVSGYDFRTARLEDLPWQMSAAIIGTGSAFDYDAYVRKHFPDWNVVQHRLGCNLFDRESFIPEGGSEYTVSNSAIIAVAFDRIDAESCRLKDGYICGDLYCSNGVVRVESGSFCGDVVLSLSVLKYKDYNRDGLMDVLVRRTLAGSACPTEALVLSRRQAGGRFHVVESVETTFQQGMDEFHRIPNKKSKVSVPLGQ